MKMSTGRLIGGMAPDQKRIVIISAGYVHRDMEGPSLTLAKLKANCFRDAKSILSSCDSIAWETRQQTGGCANAHRPTRQ